MSSVPTQYKDLLREALLSDTKKRIENDRPLKRRRRKNGTDPVESVESSSLIISPSSITATRATDTESMSRKSDGSDLTSDIDIDSGDASDQINLVNNEAKSIEHIIPKHQYKNLKSDFEESEQESDEDFNSDEFEDVDLNDIPSYEVSSNKEEINITIKPHKQNKKQLKRPTVVSREERSSRRQLHMLHLFIMTAHGVTRNMWCSNQLLFSKLLAQLPNKLKSELNDYQKHRVKKNVTTQSKTRKLLDLLRHLMNYWDSIWTIDPKAPVLYKKQWNELNKQPKKLKKRNPITEARFIRMITTHTGSRDLSALGFLAMLRALGLPARLCFSIQPPDFTNLTQVSTLESRQSETIAPFLSTQSCGKSPPRKSKRSSTQHDRLLNALRGNRTYTNSTVKTQSEQDDEFSEKYGGWPVFWVEVWDKDAKKYITIDPAVKKLIECVSWKSRLEPPMNCVRNNTWYVVGYDRLGGVRDITRRYAREFNAKVRKKRISRDEKGKRWWNAVLRGACCKNRLKENRVDKFEEIEFEEMGLKEGMPSSVSDFKGHPIYVLEDQLKWNEVLKPKISCGTVRKKTRRGNDDCDLIPVYKRSNVCSLRTAKGWYMHGRVLKIGERPLKVREKKIIKRGKRNTEDDFELSNDDDNNGDEGDRRLYAEFQTEKYVPPPVVNGKIPTNAFKNIDVYEKWMIPEGCVQVEDKNSEKAAKLMGIEYAPAVVGFDFGGDKRKQASVRLQGIVTLAEYEEAVKMLCVGLREKDEEEIIMREELINLRAWKVLLAKLKISGRLTREHGAIEDSEGDDAYKSEEGSEYWSENASKYGRQHDSEFEDGGFVVADPPIVGEKVELSFDDVGEVDRNGLNGSDFVAKNDIGTEQNDFFIKQVDPTSAKKGNAEVISLFNASSGLRFGAKDESVYDPNEEIGIKNQESADTHSKQLYPSQDRFIYGPVDTKRRNEYEDLKEEGLKEADKEYDEFENFLGELETCDNDEDEHSELEGGFEKEDDISPQVNTIELNNNTERGDAIETIIKENKVKEIKIEEVPFTVDETEKLKDLVNDAEKVEKFRSNSIDETKPMISKLDGNCTAFKPDADKASRVEMGSFKDSNVLNGSHINNVINLDSDDSEPEEIEHNAKEEIVIEDSGDNDGYDFEYSDSE